MKSLFIVFVLIAFGSLAFARGNMSNGSEHGLDDSFFTSGSAANTADLLPSKVVDTSAQSNHHRAFEISDSDLAPGSVVHVRNLHRLRD